EKAGRVRDLRTRDLPAIDHRLRESRIQGGVIAAAPRKLGRFELHCLSDGQWRMDGGSVFGVVPKVMWEKLKTPDARNRILMATNCMLVRTRDANILIEAGMGPKLSDRPENLGVLEEEGRLQVVEGDQEVAPGIRVRVTGGHTAGHQAVYVSDQEETVVFTGDFLFMRAFLKVNWVSALDLFPFEA